MSGPTLSDLKTWLGLIGTQDDVLLASCLLSGMAQAERDTGRTFAYASNAVRDYSTNGMAMVAITDIPKTDATRVVTLNGVALTETQGYWLLPDRRNPDVSTSIQLMVFDRSRTDWFKADPFWWDKNLDTFWGRYGALPLDLRISSAQGHPTITNDVFEQVRFLSAWFYWRAKSGASASLQTPTGEVIDLSVAPTASPTFVRDWMIRTAVSSV